MKCKNCGKQSGHIKTFIDDKGKLIERCHNCGGFKEAGGYPEFVPSRVKDERKKYKKDILQPFRSGEPSREFIEAYPERAKKTFTKKQLRNARDVWTDI
jgi:ribosome-binding protein aMBF1 (putative translation factor)